MPDLSDLTTRGQDLATRGQDLATKAVGTVRDTAQRAIDLVPTPGEVMDQVTTTANELLSLRKDVQDKVLAAIKWNV